MFWQGRATTAMTGLSDGAGALLAAVLATLLLAVLLPASSRTAGASGRGAAPLTVPANVTPALGRLAHTAPAQAVDVIVQMRSGASPGEGQALVRASGGRPSRTVEIINGFGARMTAAAALHLATRPGVRAVTLDGAVETRASARPAQGGGPRTSYGAAVGATELFRGWRGLTGKGVGVAVVDTGIAGELPDFRVSRRNKLSRVRVSAVVNPRATTSGDTYGHGTHVAGLIAGNGASRDLADPLRGKYEGIAPRANLISVKASDDAGNASVLDVIYGIQFAVDHAAAHRIRILNLSLSSTVADSYLNDPLDAAVESAWLKGLVVVAAAGNSGAQADSVSYAPGNDPYVITVGAVDDKGTDDRADDRLANWSSRGTTRDGHAKPEVNAPGARMVSNLAPGSRFASLCAECIRDREYFQVGGTSMSAAVVSGLAAQLLEAHPGWTPDQVKAALVRTARDLPGVGDVVDGTQAVRAVVSRQDALQVHPLSRLVAERAGDIDYQAASWRAASWRGVESGSPLLASFAAASWRCDCSQAGDGTVEPNAASWRAASWRTSFSK